MELIDKLLDSLKSIDYSGFDEAYIDDILDNRDNDPFDSEWSRVCSEVESLKNETNYTKSDEAEFLRISRQAFSILEENSCGELSAYVSDDFGLIYDSLVVNYKDEWLDKLINAYTQKKIPNGEI